jgi:hypothetical protein
MLGIRRVVGNLQSIYTAGMVTGSVPNLGRMGDYRRECCRAEGSTSTYPSLKPSDIENLDFQLPPDDKKNDFKDLCHETWNKIEYNHIQISNLEKLRDSLLPKLMNGEVQLRE